MRNSDTFSVENERSNGATHLRLAGRFDVAAALVFDEAIAVSRPRDVVLDLEAVTFMDSAAWLAIMAYEHRVHGWGMKFRLAHVPANIRRIFELTATEHLLSEAGRRTNGRAGPGGPESLGRSRAVGLSQHPDEYRPQHPILLAVDQQLGATPPARRAAPGAPQCG